MSDTDPDQAGEELDEAVEGIEYPPDRPLGATDRGVTGVEQLGGESFYERDRRTEPEVWEQRPPRPDDSVELVGDADVGAVDDESELVGDAVEEDRERGPLAPDDEFTGDETTRDTVDDRVPKAAEESAVHLRDEP